MNPFLDDDDAQPNPTKPESLNPFEDDNNNNNNNNNKLKQSIDEDELNPFFTAPSPPIAKKVVGSTKPKTRPISDEFNPFFTPPPPVRKIETATTNTTKNTVSSSKNNEAIKPNTSSNTLNEDELNPFFTPPETKKEIVNTTVTETKKTEEETTSTTQVTPNNTVNEDELNPFLTPPTESKKETVENNNPFANNNAASSNTPVVDYSSNLLNQLKLQREEFEKSQSLLKEKLLAAVKEKNDLQAAMHQLNSKYIEILEKNESLQQNRDFIKQNIQLFIDSNDSFENSTTSSPINSNDQQQQHFNFSHEIKQLHKYKSLADKSNLLRLTVKTMNNDNILMVLQFLYDTLRDRLFIDEVSKYPNLIDMFFGFLRKIGKFNDIINLQKLLKNQSEELYISLYMAINEKDMRKRRVLLGNWVNQYKSQTRYSLYIQQIEQYIGLMDRQIRIDEFDSQQALKDPFFLKYPRSPIYGRSINDTMYYMFLYHPSAPKDKLSSPISLKDSFEVSEKLFLINQLKARSITQDWNYVKNILPQKKGIFSKIYHSEIGIESFIDILTLYQAPPDLIDSCVKMLEFNESKSKPLALFKP
ncbi:hypothetical protein DLAC_06412 [Tieghemostelium lacteum]|uniref:Uncharacterized protein n=1 Tax=Tieghemostelium lacteum TaxID=361077 RepID=A0A151ZEP6_TIELA|nr:hypothetical protein DLAC_06412 [Tieghemostelium lacteum]|eukprot:KYQ92432.1 hypothetical protein DLAC_06412 [Tieghemostelium lacteum]